jgi:hypothetical protein
MGAYSRPIKHSAVAPPEVAVTESEAVAALKTALERYLEGEFDGCESDGEGGFVVRPREAPVFITPVGQDGSTLVRIWTVTNSDVEVDGELAQYLVRENASITFGNFELDERTASVRFAHALLGDFLNRDELVVAVRTMAATAHVYAGWIENRFGGDDAEDGG